MIPFVENKYCDTARIQEYLLESQRQNHWTNFGPVSNLLEQRLENKLNTSGSVVMCSSGTIALWAGMLYWEEIAKKKLKWCMSSFSFPCVPQHIFDITVLDCDEKGMLDLELADGYEGIIITNLFGSYDMGPYRELTRNKVTLIDAAMNFDSHDHGLFEMISFHHTKPWGFGEGGCLITPKENKPFRSIINSGRTTNQKHYKHYSTNGKISELACAGILQRLDRFNEYKPVYQLQYKRISSIALELGCTIIGNSNKGLPCNVPIVFPSPVIDIRNDLVVLGKYYEPIAPTPRALDLYQRIVNFPCHPGVTLEDSDIKSLLIKLISNSA